MAKLPPPNLSGNLVRLRPIFKPDSFAEFMACVPSLLELKADQMYRYLIGLGFTIPKDASILFEEDVTPLEVDITSWHPVVARKEILTPDFEHWILFEKVA